MRSQRVGLVRYLRHFLLCFSTLFEATADTVGWGSRTVGTVGLLGRLGWGVFL